jgi:hypothetical protein
VQSLPPKIRWVVGKGEAVCVPRGRNILKVLGLEGDSTLYRVLAIIRYFSLRWLFCTYLLIE